MKNNEDKITFKDIIKLTLIIGTIVVYKVFFFDIANVYGASMQPTLNEQNDKIIINKFDNNFKRGQIIVFDSKENGLYVKRIIGLPNDTVEIKNGKVYVNNKELNEPYIKGITFSFEEKYTVPKDNLFVLGDNRENSKDSRLIGFVNFNQVKGIGIFKFNLVKLEAKKIGR